MSTSVLLRFLWLGMMGLLLIGIAASCTTSRQSLQDMIDKAKAGETIQLPAGTWEENLVINKDITIRGAVGSKPTEIKSKRKDKPVILIESYEEIEVDFENLVLTASKETKASGILILGKAKAKIKDSTLSGFDTALDLGDSTQVAINSSTLAANSIGLVLRSTSQATLANTTLADNEKGLRLQGSSQLNLSNSTVSKNGVGLELGETAQAQLFDSTFSDNVMTGLSLQGSAQAILSRSIVSASMSGLELQGSAKISLENSTVSKHKSSGIELRDTAQADLSDTTVSDNTIAGLDLGDSAQARLTDSTVSDNTFGLQLKDSSQATLFHTLVSKNANGLELWNLAQASIRASQIVDNSAYGIVLLQSPCYEIDEKFEGKVDGSNNEIRGNQQGDLCPMDYPWPQGFLKERS